MHGGGGGGDNESEWTGIVALRTSKHPWLYSNLLLALKEEYLSALGSQQLEGTLISASAVAHCGFE